MQKVDFVLFAFLDVLLFLIQFNFNFKKLNLLNQKILENAVLFGGFNFESEVGDFEHIEAFVVEVVVYYAVRVVTNILF